MITGARCPCSLCYSRAASVFVPAPTQHLVTWPIHGHVSQFSNRAPRLPAWRALRRAAVPLAASRHQRCTRIAHTWLRCCCTAARDVVWLLWCRGAVHRLGSMAHCVSLLLFLQWVSRGAVRQALLQMVHGTALLMVLGACASSCTSWCSAASRCVAAVQWTGLLSSHVRLASRTWSGPQAQSHAQCDLPLAWYERPAQASSPGSCLLRSSASVPACRTRSATLGGVPARAAHASLQLFDGHTVSLTACPSHGLAAIATAQVTRLSCGTRYHGANASTVTWVCIMALRL